jgi:hypothetical protein
MSELTEQRWAVLSERGCEATGLTYAQAAELMRALMRERVSGLSVITDDAAQRASRTINSQARHPNPNGTKTKLKIKN